MSEDGVWGTEPTLSNRPGSDGWARVEEVEFGQAERRKDNILDGGSRRSKGPEVGMSHRPLRQVA